MIRFSKIYDFGYGIDRIDFELSSIEEIRRGTNKLDRVYYIPGDAKMGGK